VIREGDEYGGEMTNDSITMTEMKLVKFMVKIIRKRLRGEGMSVLSGIDKMIHLYTIVKAMSSV
jgi:hypothetical protein